MHPGHSIGAVYLYRPAIDFRKSIGGLSALVEQELASKPIWAKVESSSRGEAATVSRVSR